jgi:hypothetical protein
MTTKRNEDIAKLLLKSLPPDASPNFEELVAWARYIADVYARLSEREKELNRSWALPPIGKKAAADAPQRAFSAAISNDFQRLFGQPLDDAAGALTEVVFNLPDGLDRDTIRGRRRSAARAAHSRKKST